MDSVIFCVKLIEQSLFLFKRGRVMVSRALVRVLF